MSKPKVGVFVGSLRKESYTKKVALLLSDYMKDQVDFEFVDLSAIEIYNQDYDDEGKPTSAWTSFRTQVKKFDAFLFVTPEYNRSVPAVLKNALDVGSRPYGQSVWGGKPGAVVSVSPGGLSGFGANHHLRQSLVFLDIPVMQQPEAYIGNVANLLDEKGQVKEEKTKEFFKSIANSYVKWIKNFIK